ncbi:MAG: hypothetical protein ACFFFG_01870 [Candidatus Thorarchaeota archaeon]
MGTSSVKSGVPPLELLRMDTGSQTIIWTHMEQTYGINPDKVYYYDA